MLGSVDTMRNDEFAAWPHAPCDVAVPAVSKRRTRQVLSQARQHASTSGMRALVGRVLPPVLDYSIIAPDLNLAVAAFGIHADDMAKKRKPIDDLIDALVWMRRQNASGHEETRSKLVAGAGSPTFPTSLIIQPHSRALVVLNPEFHAAC
jgi:hypothetical protein